MMMGSAETILDLQDRLSAEFTVNRFYQQHHRIDLFQFNPVIDLK